MSYDHRDTVFVQDGGDTTYPQDAAVPEAADYQRTLSPRNSGNGPYIHAPVQK